MYGGWAPSAGAPIAFALKLRLRLEKDWSRSIGFSGELWASGVEKKLRRRHQHPPVVRTGGQARGLLHGIERRVQLKLGLAIGLSLGLGLGLGLELVGHCR